MILALHTASQPYSIAVFTNDTLFETTFHATHAQSESLIDEIETLCKKADGTLSDITAIGITQGPGGYTGIRLGITTAKTIAQVLNIPIFGLSTLEAFVKQHVIGTNTHLVTLPATRHDLNIALFTSKNGIYKRLTPDFTCSPQHLKTLLKKFQEPIVQLGHEPLHANTLIRYVQECLKTQQAGSYKNLHPHYTHPPTSVF